MIELRSDRVRNGDGVQMVDRYGGCKEFHSVSELSRTGGREEGEMQPRLMERVHLGTCFSTVIDGRPVTDVMQFRMI